MDIVISNSSDLPIYQQIKDQIIFQIASSAIKPEEQLPSIRFLAKELKVSVITTKKAYEELEKDGYIETVPGKGSFVSSMNLNILKEKQLDIITKDIDNIITDCKRFDVSKEKLLKLIDILWN